MAKQFLDEAGVTTLWTKCKNTFALNDGAGFPTIPAFNVQLNNWNPDKVSFATHEYYFKCEGGLCLFMFNLDFKVNETTYIDMLAFDYSFWQKFDIASISPYLLDADGIRLSVASQQKGASICMTRLSALPLQATDYPSTSIPINVIACRGDANLANIMQIFIACSPSYQFSAGAEYAIHGTMVIPLWKI